MCVCVCVCVCTTQAVAFSRQVKADLSPPDTLVGCVTFPAASSTASADVAGSRNGQGQPEAAGAAPAPVAATVSISLAAGQVRVYTALHAAFLDMCTYVQSNS